MNKYSKVAEPTDYARGGASQVPHNPVIHALMVGAASTMCGTLTASDTVPVRDGHVVTCALCTTALVNMRRASDHLAPAAPDTSDTDVYLADLLAVRSTKAFREDDQALGRALANLSTWLLLGQEPRDAKLPHDSSVVQARDAVVEANRKLLLERSNVGIDKYGVTLEQSGLTQRQFIQHALEETLDLANYLQATLMQTPQ